MRHASNPVTESQKRAVQQAVSILGGQSALARVLGIRQAMVWKWCNGKARVCAENVLPIARAVEHKVRAHQIRPDLYPVDFPVVPADEQRITSIKE